MTVNVLRNEISSIGYSAVVSNYKSSDVFAPMAVDRTAVSVAFTQTPPSYRNAALAVVNAENLQPSMSPQNFEHSVPHCFL